MLFYGMYFEPLYLVMVAPTFLFALLAQMWVKSAYARYSRVRTRMGYSGAEAARLLLQREGIFDVRVEMVRGWLSDHYDPKQKVLRLSPDVFQGISIASVGIAAHEAGHAIQHARNYSMLSLRSAIVPVASIGSKLAIPLIIIGAFLHAAGMIQFGIVLFALMVVFQIITLPVEFDASRRAKIALVEHGILADEQELHGVRSVLGAAAMTYVAAALTAVMQLLYFIMRFSQGSSRD